MVGLYTGGLIFGGGAYSRRFTVVTMMVLAGHQNRVTPIGDQIVDVVSNFSI